MRIGRFRKSPGDRKRYEVNYADWLNEGETITNVTLQGNTPEDDFYIEGFLIQSNGVEVVFYISGGVVTNTYTVTVAVTTSLNQIKEDTIEFVVV